MTKHLDLSSIRGKKFTVSELLETTDYIGECIRKGTDAFLKTYCPDETKESATRRHREFMEDIERATHEISRCTKALAYKIIQQTEKKENETNN